MPKSVSPASTSAPTCQSQRSHSASSAREVGEHELDALELDDPAARLPALVDVGDAVLERGAGDAERVRGDRRAATC